MRVSWFSCRHPGPHTLPSQCKMTRALIKSFSLAISISCKPPWPALLVAPSVYAELPGTILAAFCLPYFLQISLSVFSLKFKYFHWFMQLTIILNNKHWTSWLIKHLGMLSVCMNLIIVEFQYNFYELNIEETIVNISLYQPGQRQSMNVQQCLWV